MGSLNTFAGIGSGMSTIVGEFGKNTINLNSKIASRIVAGGIAGGTEMIYDFVSYLIEKLRSIFE